MNFLKKLKSIGEGINDAREAVDDFKSGNIIGGVKDLYSSAKDIGEVVQQVKKQHDDDSSNQNTSQQNSQTQPQTQSQSNPQQPQSPSNQQQLQYQSNFQAQPDQSQNYMQQQSNQTYDQQQALQIQQIVQSYQLLQQQFLQQNTELQQYRQYLQQLQENQKIQQLQDQQKELEFQQKLKILEDKLFLSTEKEKALNLKEMELERERIRLEQLEKAQSMALSEKLALSSNSSQKQIEASPKDQIENIIIEAEIKSQKEKPVLISNSSTQSPSTFKNSESIQVKNPNTSPISFQQPQFQFQPQLQNPSQFTLPPPIQMQNQQFQPLQPFQPFQPLQFPNLTLNQLQKPATLPQPQLQINPQNLKKTQTPLQFNPMPNNLLFQTQIQPQYQNPNLLQPQNLSKTQMPVLTQNPPQVSQFPIQTNPQVQINNTASQPQMGKVNQSPSQIQLPTQSQQQQNQTTNTNNDMQTMMFQTRSNAPILIKGNICINQNQKWSILQQATITTEYFIHLPISCITKAKIKAESGVQGCKNIKISTGDQETFFSVPEHEQVEWAAKLIWGRLGILNKNIDINANFTGQIAGILVKKSLFKGWEPRHVSISSVTGLKSSKSANDAPTVLVKNVSEVWTRFQIINGMYLAIKFVFTDAKMEYGIPLQNAVAWIRAFHSLIH